MFQRFRPVRVSALGVIAATTGFTPKSVQCERPLIDASGRPRSVMYVRDPAVFSRKWKKFSSAGIDQLVVIADFDYTLTPRFLPDGVSHGDSSHGILMKSDALDPALHQLGHELFERYWPIEQSTTLSNEEKLPYLIEWWNTEHELLIKYKLTREIIVDAVEKNDLAFREGCMDLLKILSDAKVPTLIFSAGLYDVIHAVLNKAYANASPPTVVPPNIHVVSNMMEFNKDGQLVGFQGKVNLHSQLIHSQNKNASVVTDTPFWRQCQLEQRQHILLLGDSIHDVNMSNGLNVEEDQIVRIGFLNERVEEQLDLYLNKYDIVLTHDSSLIPVEVLLQTL